jgi:hypothetical protein
LRSPKTSEVRSPVDARSLFQLNETRLLLASRTKPSSEAHRRTTRCQSITAIRPEVSTSNLCRRGNHLLTVATIWVMIKMAVLLYCLRSIFNLG